MTDFEFAAFLFVGFLAAIVFGIFIGIAMADYFKQRRKQRVVQADNSKLERTRQEAFARMDGRRPKSPRPTHAPGGLRTRDILDAEVLD